MVNTGSRNGLLPDGVKSLSELMLTQLLSHPGIPGVTLCFCTGSYAAAGAAAGRRFLSMR